MANGAARHAFRFAQAVRSLFRALRNGLARLSAPLAPLHHRLVAGKRRDYLVASGVGLLLLVVAPLFGVWHNVLPSAKSWIALGCKGSPEAFLGIASRYNWWIYPVALPLALFCIRHLARKLFSLGQGQPCAIAGLVEGEDKESASVLINRAAVDPTVLGGVLLLALILNAVDIREVLTSYLGHWLQVDFCPREKDWSVFFVIRDTSGVGPLKNLVFVLIAYAEQFALATLGLLVFGLCLVHNTVYLGLVYQRRRNAPPEEHIVLRFADADHHFGQSALHAVFDWQIVYLLLTGAAVLVSRYANARPATQNIVPLLAKFAAKPGLETLQPVLMGLLRHGSSAPLFPDVGQIILFVCFALCFLCVVAPSFLKFLPYGGLPRPQRSLYLAEFVPPTPEADHDPARMTSEQLDAVAKAFAQNSFWPAGDLIATGLFSVAFFVLLVILLPIPGTPLADCLAGTTVTITLAGLLTTITFFLYRQALRIIDKTLVAKD
jgi:hypothetical protein